MERLKSEQPDEGKRQNRPAETGVSRKNSRREEEEPKEEERVGTASDDEVEEFYAIIRRMRAAGRKMRKTNPCDTTGKARFQWRPRFSLEDFGRGEEENDGSEIGGKSVAGDRSKRGRVYFDLNTEPEPESELAAAVGSFGPVTVSCLMMNYDSEWTPHDYLVEEIKTNQRRSSWR